MIWKSLHMYVDFRGGYLLCCVVLLFTGCLLFKPVWSGVWDKSNLKGSSSANYWLFSSVNSSLLQRILDHLQLWGLSHPQLSCEVSHMCLWHHMTGFVPLEWHTEPHAQWTVAHQSNIHVKFWKCQCGRFICKSEGLGGKTVFYT